ARDLSVRSVAAGKGAMLQDIDYVVNKLDWMRHRRIWPNGLRYLWTDAFGLVLLVSLYRKLGDLRYLDAAEQLVAEVERVLAGNEAFGSGCDGAGVAIKEGHRYSIDGASTSRQRAGSALASAWRTAQPGAVREAKRRPTVSLLG